jgi:hypothetical protein
MPWATIPELPLTKVGPITPIRNLPLSQGSETRSGATQREKILTFPEACALGARQYSRGCIPEGSTRRSLVP